MLASDLILAGLFFIGALLYSSVGHAGASAYLAIMALMGVAPEAMRPIALSLNIAVALLVSWNFLRAGFFDKRLLLLLIIGSIPMAFLGGSLHVPPQYYRPLLGVILFIAAIRLLLPRKWLPDPEINLAPAWQVILSGAAIGLLSGITGTGGGIFLTPLLIWTGWADTKKSAGISASFILVNSSAALLANVKAVASLPSSLPLFLIAVLLGSLIGSRLGIYRYSSQMFLKALALVLLIAAGKLLFS